MKPLSKWKINYPPKILCQTVSFYLLHRGNISKIALQVPATSKYIILCASNECRRSQVRNSAMKNSFIRKCLLQSQICFRRIWEKHQALKYEHGYLYSRGKFLRGRKGQCRTTRLSNSPGALPARESLGSALSKKQQKSMLKGRTMRSLAVLDSCCRCEQSRDPPGEQKPRRGTFTSQELLRCERWE